VKVEMEMVIQQYEKAKVIQEEQLERLTQICQEQGVTHHHFQFCSFLSRPCWAHKHLKAQEARGQGLLRPLVGFMGNLRPSQSWIQH
jgi:hypothetical protein